jgi:hypothetical protein
MNGRDHVTAADGLASKTLRGATGYPITRTILPSLPPAAKRS